VKVGRDTESFFSYTGRVGTEKADEDFDDSMYIVEWDKRK
jgi:hypothetical protein